MPIIKDKNKRKRDRRRKRKNKATMVEWLRIRYLAAIIHDVECTWNDGSFCGHTDCEWGMEEMEQQPWAESVHTYYVAMAESIVKKNKKSLDFYEALIDLFKQHERVIEKISDSVFQLCVNAEIEMEPIVRTKNG